MFWRQLEVKQIYCYMWHEFTQLKSQVIQTCKPRLTHNIIVYLSDMSEFGHLASALVMPGTYGWGWLPRETYPTNMGMSHYTVQVALLEIWLYIELSVSFYLVEYLGQWGQFNSGIGGQFRNWLFKKWNWEILNRKFPTKPFLSRN